MKLTVNLEKPLGDIRPLHGVGQPPISGIDGVYMHYLTEAHIPYSRLHDVGGMYGGFIYVDIPNIFRDFSANEYDPASYDFGFTDILLKQLADANCKPIYRLGVTIENYQAVKAYRIYPPTDFAKWAHICEYIIKHYNDGWGNGFHYGIKYWEIWNEPDGYLGIEHDPMWKGTMQEYFELYEITSKHLKKRFGNSIKIGGYGSSGFYTAVNAARDERQKYFLEFFEKFLIYVKETNSPLDFFSWHSYGTTETTMAMADYAEQMLNKHGFHSMETQCNEWNNARELAYRGTSYASAQAASMMIAMHDKKTDLMCYYDARLGPSQYGGLFNPLDHKPLCTYYSFKAFGELYVLGTRVEAYGGNSDIRILAAKNDSDKCAVMISNTGETTAIETNLSGMKVILIDQDHHFTETDLKSENFTLAKNQVSLLISE